MTGVVLRHAQAGDADGAAHVLLQSRKQFLAYAPLAHSGEEVRQWLREVIIPAGATVAVAQGQVVGLLVTSTSADGARWIDQLYIHPAHVGRGIGTRLLAHALATLPLPIRLYTFQQNAGARRFYERHGFVALEFSDGSANEERCPDVLYELAVPPLAGV
jgi:ribosomal protein S18 acetylase RimI-like enzyme